MDRLVSSAMNLAMNLACLTRDSLTGLTGNLAMKLACSESRERSSLSLIDVAPDCCLFPPHDYKGLTPLQVGYIEAMKAAGWGAGRGQHMEAGGPWSACLARYGPGVRFHLFC